MTKKIWTIMTIVSFLLFTGAIGFASSDLNLESDEKIITVREADADEKEVFLEKDGKELLRKYTLIDGEWKVESEAPVDIHKRGLVGLDKLGSSQELEVLVKNYLDSNKYDLGALPGKVDYSNSQYLPPVGKQEENSCVGWAVGYYLRTFQLAKEMDWSVSENGKPVPSKVFSPNFLYNQINGGEDNGATLQEAGKLLKNVGAATLKDFPYNQGDYKTKPTYDVVRSGYKYRIKDSYSLFSRSDISNIKISKLKEYLLTGDLPVVGVDAGYSWEIPHKDESGNFIVTKDDSYIGGHAVVVVGYDDSFKTPDGTGAFKVLNSWGAEWANGGYAYVSYEAMVEDSISGTVYTDLERFRVENRHESYIDGYGDGTFKPNEMVTRAEAVKMIVGLDSEPLIQGPSFPDSENHWASREIYTAFTKGYVTGYPDGNFLPNKSIKRAEFATIIYKKMGSSIPKGGDYVITKYFYDSIDHSTSRYVNTLGSMRLIGGYPDGSFKPEENITRAEAVMILNRIQERIPQEDFISSIDNPPFKDVIENGKKHWAYGNIFEASKNHVYEYNLDQSGELDEKWKKVE